VAIDILVSGVTGLGHASRSTAVARELYKLGERDIRIIAPTESQEFLVNNLQDLEGGITLLTWRYHPDRFEAGEDGTSQRERELFQLENGKLIRTLTEKRSGVIFTDFPRAGLYLKELFPEPIVVGHYHDMFDSKTNGSKKRERWAEKKRRIRDELTDLFIYSGLQDFSVGEPVRSLVPLFATSPLVRAVTVAPEDVKSRHGIKKEEKFGYVTVGGMGKPADEKLIEELYASLGEINLDEIGLDYLIVTNVQKRPIDMGKNAGKIIVVDQVYDGNNYVNAADIVLATGGRGTVNEALIYQTPHLFVYSGTNEEVLGNIKEVQERIGVENYWVQNVTTSHIQETMRNMLSESEIIKRLYQKIEGNGAGAVAKSLIALNGKTRGEFEGMLTGLQNIFGPEIPRVMPTYG
jgi:hypothetical protein